MTLQHGTVNVEEHRPGGVRRIRRVDPATGQAPEQEAIDGSKGEPPSFCLLARARDVPEAVAHVEAPGCLELAHGPLRQRCQRARCVTASARVGYWSLQRC